MEWPKLEDYKVGRILLTRLHRIVGIVLGVSLTTFAGGFFVTQHLLRMNGIRVDISTLDYELQPKRLTSSHIAKLDLSSGFYNAPLHLALQQERRFRTDGSKGKLIYLGAVASSDESSESSSSLESLKSFVQ